MSIHDLMWRNESPSPIFITIIHDNEELFSGSRRTIPPHLLTLYVKSYRINGKDWEVKV